MNLYGQFRARFAADPAAPFLIEPNGAELSYAALDERTRSLAARLAELGASPGDRVAVQAEKSVSGLLLYLATLRAGAIHLPLNPAYTAAEVRYFLEDSEPALFVGDPARGSGARRSATFEEVVGGAPAKSDFEDVARDPDDLAAILYTSGTTGRSKGAILTHANLASNAETLREAWRFTAADRLLHALPIFHTHGLFVATNVTLLAGGSMLFLPAFDLDEILRLLPRATTMMGVPTFYTRLLTRPDLTRELVSHIRLFVSGSAPLSAETHREFEARTGHAILERYGMTETNMNTSNPYEGPRVAGTVGPPLPGVEIRIADRTSGAELARGEVGIIEIRGPNVCKGYWRKPDKSAEAFRDDGYFISGDMGLIDEAGYVRIVGRDKDLIITGGLNVYPAEVEAAIEALPGVAECAVIGVPHPDFGEAVVAVVVPRADSGIDEGAICSALGESLAAFKRPKRIFVADGLPRNAMGKVQKTVLRERHSGSFASQGPPRRMDAAISSGRTRSPARHARLDPAGTGRRWTPIKSGVRSPARHYGCAARRWGHPGQQQGRRLPSLRLERPQSIRLFLVATFLADSIQQIHSLRASAVISSQVASAAGSSSSAAFRSWGRSCTTPPEMCLSPVIGRTEPCPRPGCSSDKMGSQGRQARDDDHMVAPISRARHIRRNRGELHPSAARRGLLVDKAWRAEGPGASDRGPPPCGRTRCPSPAPAWSWPSS
jgi:malonyl-CoA/methylmalonyl-CoA synthetase